MSRTRYHSLCGQKNLIQIAREHREKILSIGINNKALSEKFNISLEEVNEVRNYVRAFSLEKQEEEGIPQHWYEAAALIGRIAIRYIKNREWSAFYKSHGQKLGFEEEELKPWGHWLVARQEVGYLIELEPLFEKEEILPEVEKEEVEKKGIKEIHKR